MSESRRGYKLARSSLLVSTPQSRLTPCQLPVRGAFWFVQPPIQKLSPQAGKVARSAERGAVWSRQVPLIIPPQSRLAPCQLPRKRWRLLVQCKHIVQCRTPRGAIVSMGLRGVQGGPKGRNRNLPRPPLQKSITSSLLFPVPSASLQGRWQRGCRGCRGRSLRPRRWRAPVRRPPECRRPRI